MAARLLRTIEPVTATSASRKVMVRAARVTGLQIRLFQACSLQVTVRSALQPSGT